MRQRIAVRACAYLFGAILLVLGTSTTGSAVEKATKSPRLNRQIENLNLKDAGGVSRSLEALADKRFVVVAFVGVDCPLVKLYAPRLAELAAQYESQGVAFLGINSNPQDAPTEIAGFARQNGITFPILKDLDGAVAEQFGAERTPEVFVLDQEHKIRYCGRIDDQFSLSDSTAIHRTEASRADLRMAFDELLAGKDVSVAETPAAGCLIGKRREAKSDSPVTYSNQIARIFQNRCVECHRAGEIGPFNLLSYEDTIGWGDMIREVVDNGRMPPWGADPRYGEFKNDAHLSDEEKQTIATWVENGCPQGDPKDLPEPREFVDGWRIGTPDQVLYMSEKPYTIPAEGVVEYQYFEVDPGFTKDTWVKAVDPRPGNPAVVHHIIVFVKPKGATSATMGPGGLGPTDLLAGYAPGTPPYICGDGVGRLVKAGSTLVFQLHYTPNGTKQQDRSYLGMKFADADSVQFNSNSGVAANFGIDIPPHAEDYVATANKKFRRDSLLYSFMPHMHWRGKAFRYELEYPDGKREILLDVPRYDFNWQLVYEYTKPKFIPAGSTMIVTGHYDNSANNPANPDPSQRVRWGDQTWEEMLIGWYVASDAKPIKESPIKDSLTP